MLDVAKRSREASLKVANSSVESRNHAILGIAEEIGSQRQQLVAANSKDVNDATQSGLASPLVKRPKLDDAKIDSIIKGLTAVAQLEDPLNRTLLSIEMDQGLELYKITCPIGVVCAIFESRPDALVQIASLCLKSANAVILKGGVEAKNTNRILTDCIRKCLRRFEEIPEDTVQLIETREDIDKLLKMDEYIDLLLPRGSSSLVKYVKENSRIPVLGHAEGICHEYVDADADVDMAVEICYDAKVQHPAVCNAMNALLIHKDIAPSFLPKIAERYQKARVELRGDERTRKLLPEMKAVTEKDWSTEYLDLILAIKIVDSVKEAVDHINHYSTHHTDGIVTNNTSNARRFLNDVSSAVVLHNASTRFSDGYRFGLGAEVGISTGKTHARGPVGLEGLVTYKYVVVGSGQIVSSYVGEHPKAFTHRPLKKTWN
ncbi:MAG TPA: glutamate-5-semialdehyde dehydrogenase [Candidatus Acidoferrum sp.]|nr:glutamate-5-semialdehyde dehydrogenase [Candidatus Acidoferrum sp.]